MGNCLGQSTDHDRQNVAVPNRKKVINKGQQLRRDKLKWKSDIPLSTFQIVSKRDEFWDTAPAFEGRQEIWDALKAAVEANERGDFELAQAIIDGASIILPLGTLHDCYDELGNRYQLPLYVLSFPTNLASPPQLPPPLPVGAAMVTVPSGSSAVPVVKGDHHHHHRHHHHHHSSSGSPTAASQQQQQQQQQQKMMQLRVRLSSNNKDYSMLVDPRLNVAAAKQQFSVLCGAPALRQRWFCYGRLLENVRSLSHCTIPPNFLIQAIVSPDSIIATDPADIDQS